MEETYTYKLRCALTRKMKKKCHFLVYIVDLIFMNKKHSKILFLISGFLLI